METTHKHLFSEDGDCITCGLWSGQYIEQLEADLAQARAEAVNAREADQQTIDTLTAELSAIWELCGHPDMVTALGAVEQTIAELRKALEVSPHLAHMHYNVTQLDLLVAALKEYRMERPNRVQSDEVKQLLFIMLDGAQDALAAIAATEEGA